MTGQIKVDSTSYNVEVWLDDKYMKPTPLTIDFVKPGMHQIRFVDRFAKVYYKDVQVNDNKLEEVTINPEMPDKSSVKEGDIQPIEQPQIPTESTILAQIMKRGLNDINDSLGKLQQLLIPPAPIRIYDVTNTIATAVTSPQPDNLSVYQYDKINDDLGKNADVIYVYNLGPGNLFIIWSDDGQHYKSETLIKEGQQKAYRNVYSIGARSPTTGLTYNTTERFIYGQTSETFTGSRFKDRRDRKGTVIFKDDFESPTAKYLSGNDIPGGTFQRSIDFSYSGDFSVKTTSGFVVGSGGGIQYTHRDVHNSKVGFQIKFYLGIGTDLTNEIISLVVAGSTPTNNVSAELRVDPVGNIFILNSDDTTYSKILSSASLTNSIIGQNTWNTFKLVIDISTGFYTRANVNGVNFDLSKVPIFFPPASNPTVGLLVTIHTITNDANNYTVYFDDYIVTEDEPS